MKVRESLNNRSVTKENTTSVVAIHENVIVMFAI